MNEKEHKAALGIVSQLVRYVPTGGSLWIFGSFIKDRDWHSAVITFLIMVIMIAWSAYSKGFLLQIQERMNKKGKKGAESRIQRVQKLDFLNFRIVNTNAETADLSGANLSDANLIGANLKYSNLSDANLNCTLLSGALLFLINLREVLNLEPLQLKAKPSPFLCNVALPSYSQQLNVNVTPPRPSRVPEPSSDNADL